MAIEQELARLQGREENRQERFFAAEQDLRAQATAQEEFVRGLTESRLEGIEAIDAAERQALRSLEELRSQQRAVEGLTRSAVLDIERRAAEDQARIQAEFHQRRLEQLDEEAAAVEKLAETERLAKERAAAAELAVRRRQVETLGAESLAALDALLENQAAKEGANVERIFRIKQSLGVSEIAIETAKNIAESYPNPALTAGALAVGALQTAAVLGAPKPETRHTGGMITPDTGWPVAGGAPDERIVTVKVGEEVSEGRRQQPVIVVAPPRSRHKDEAFLRAFQTPSTSPSAPLRFQVEGFRLLG